MVNNAETITEMVNQTNYAEMSYNELVTLNFAFLLAEGEIKPLIEKKRAEEMERHADEFVTLMDNYGASKAEILALIEKKAMREKPYGPTPSQDVDDQTPSNDVDDNQDKGESVLALPEHCSNTMDNGKDDGPDSADAIEAPATEGGETEKAVSMETKGKPFVEEVVEIMKTISLPENVNPQKPYYNTCDFSCGDNGEFGHSDPFGRNMSRKDLEEFRAASEKYVRLFLKKEVELSTDEYLVYEEGKDSIKVRYYHIPEQTYEDAATSAPKEDANNHLSAIEEEDLKEKRRILKRAIKQAKEMSFSNGTDANVPFYDRYTFHPFLNTAELDKGPERFNEDAATLSEIMPAFETYARHLNQNTVVLSKNNCVAVMVGRIIYLVLFNIPKIPTQKKRRGVKNSPKSVIKEMSSPVEDSLISKAVKMTKALPVGNGTDVNAPYFVQCDLSVIGDGDLFQKGKPFIKNMSGEEEFAKLRRNHLRFAKTMKARQIEEADDYTAFFWNEGKNLSVFYYNTKGLAATAA